MNKYESRIMILTGILLALFLFSLLYNAFSRKIDVPACVTYNSSYEKSQVKKIDDSTYEVYAVAKMWAFDPSEIEVPAGSTVDLYLTSADVVHGFDLEGRSLNLMAVPGGVNKATIKFTKPGVYRITCHEYCGSGHQNMQGQFIVNYKK